MAQVKFLSLMAELLRCRARLKKSQGECHETEPNVCPNTFGQRINSSCLEAHSVHQIIPLNQANAKSRVLPEVLLKANAAAHTSSASADGCCKASSLRSLSQLTIALLGTSREHTLLHDMEGNS